MKTWAGKWFGLSFNYMYIQSSNMFFMFSLQILILLKNVVIFVS